MPKILMVDPEKCTGCRLCQLACAQKKEGRSDPTLSRIFLYEWHDDGFIPVVCHNCEDPVCEAVCPVNALRHDKDMGGLVMNADRCVVCLSCISVCPHGGARYHKRLNKVLRCDFCNGDPACVAVCEPGAIWYVDEEVAECLKKRAAAQNIFCSIFSPG